MKTLSSLILACVIVSGCGVRTDLMPTAPLRVKTTSGPIKGDPIVSPQAATPVQGDPIVSPHAAVPGQNPSSNAQTDTPTSMFKELAGYGPLLTDLETLEPGEESSYGVQTTPEKTQEKADRAALEWSTDAQQIYLGWGFRGISWFGTSRHVYFSPSKKRTLTLNYGFFGGLKSRYESSSIVLTLGGSLITKLLREPRDVHAFSGRRAWSRAKQNGFKQATRGTTKALLLEPYFIGPVWVFLDESNKPSMIINAHSGDVSTDGYLLSILRYLF